MKTVILCGGLGTRLREETEFRPKPMVEIGGRPILWHIMKQYAHFGFNEFVLCLGYKGNMIKEYFLNYEAMNNDFTIRLGCANGIDYHGTHKEVDFKVTLAETGLETMTGGRLKRVQKYLNESTFMLTYGDGVSDINIKKLLDFHLSHGKIATVSSVRTIFRFGMIELNPDGQVVRFAEKPRMYNWMNAGFFVFNSDIFNYIDSDETQLEKEPLQRLVNENQLMSYKHEGFFYAMDTYREYQYLNELWTKNEAPWKIWE